MPEERCPRCFNQIDGIWTDDPIKTPKGEAGEAYKGFTYLKPSHIEEIQQIRQQQEEDLGFIDPASTGYVEGEDTPKTVFSPVRVEGQKVYFYKKHLRELRESTEKILEATGQTKDSFFNYDEEETEYNIGDHQSDWHDIDLTQKFLDIKAVHIEDLRHYLSIGWFDDFTDITPIQSGSGSSHSYARRYPTYYYSYTDTDATYWNEATDRKTDKLQIGDRAHTYAEWNTAGDYRPNDGDRADGRADFSITITKPISISVSSSANANITNPLCEDGLYAYGEHQNSGINWIQDYFKNPFPNPQIKITQNSKIYVEISNLTHSSSGRYNDLTGGYYDDSSYGMIRLVIRLYDSEENFYNLEYYLAPSFHNTAGKMCFILQNGRNELTMPESLFASGQPTFYFCKYIQFWVNCSSRAVLNGYGSISSSSSLSFTLDKIGII